MILYQMDAAIALRMDAAIALRMDAAIARRDRAIQVALDQFDAEIHIIFANNIETVSPPSVPDIQLPMSDIQLKDALDKIPVGSLMAAKPL